MEIRYKDYTYIDPLSDDTNVYDYTNPEHRAICDQYMFDQSKFDDLKRQGNHIAAWQYRRKYHSNNPEQERIAAAAINKYGMEARRHDAIFNKAVENGGNDAYALQLAASFSTSGNFNGYENNPLIDKVRDLKAYIGSDSEFNLYRDNPLDLPDITKEATRLSFSFAPSTRKLFKNVDSPFWSGDWILRDNNNTIDEFINRVGVSKENLERAGVIFDKDDKGRDRVSFDKANDYATLLIINASRTGVGLSTIMSSYDFEGNVIKDNVVLEENIGNYGVALHRMKTIIDDAKKTAEDYFSSKTQSLQINSYDSMPLEDLSQEKKYKTFTLDAVLKAGIMLNYDMYTNTGVVDKKTDTNVTLRLLEDQKAKVQLANLLQSTDYKDLTIRIKSVNGVEGISITRRPTEIADKDKKKNKDYKDQYLNDAIEVWLPGLMPNGDADAYANNDANLTALKEVNNMKMYNYNYKTSKGEEIIPSLDGFVYTNGTEAISITLEEANRIVAKDMIIDEAMAYMYSYCRNNQGKIYDSDKYDSLAKKLAIKAGNEMYSNIPLLKDDNTPMSIDEIFNMRGFDDVAEPYASSMSDAMYRKLRDIFNIYIEIMSYLPKYR